MNNRPLLRTGFTLVELLIVIVVIAILATISTVAYSNIQGRARDTRRLVDVKHITQALEVYRAKYGQYPTSQNSSWELSTTYSNNFINSLVTNGIVDSVPVDPKNSSQFYYRYYRYAAGSYGCDASRGAYYVLQIRQGETDLLKNSSPGHTCPTRDWTPEMPNGYTISGFTNG